MPERSTESVASQYRYDLLTWPEINEAVAMKKVVVLPVGAIEQHGPHLPLDTDFKLASSVAYEAGRRSPQDMLVMPPSRTATPITSRTSPGRSTSSPPPSFNFSSTSPAPSPTMGSSASSS